MSKFFKTNNNLSILTVLYDRLPINTFIHKKKLFLENMTQRVLPLNSSFVCNFKIRITIKRQIERNLIYF